METAKRVLSRTLLLAAIIAMLYYMPTREFLKTTFFLGMPFIIALAIMRKKTRYSFVWILALLALLGIGGGYIYLLSHLPEQIETRRIISEGGSLVAEGKFDQAIDEYKKLEGLGRAVKMEEKIAVAEREKSAAAVLQEARDLLAAGEREKAKSLLESIPGNTRAGVQAKRMQKSLQDKGVAK